MFLMLSGIFGSERLIQKVVDKILLQTAVLSVDEDMDDGGEGDGGGGDGSPRKPPEGATAWDGMTASKIILTGPAVGFLVILSFRRET